MRLLYENLERIEIWVIMKLMNYQNLIEVN